MQFKALKELRSLDEKNLEKEIKAAKEFLNGISFEKSQGNLKDTSQLRKTRVYISRIETIKNERTESGVTSSETEKSE